MPRSGRRPYLSTFSSTGSFMRLGRSRSNVSFASTAPVAAIPPAASAPVTPAPPPADQDEAEDYFNPHYGNPRWLLTARALAVRTAASIGASLFGLLYRPTRTIYLDACTLISKTAGPPPSTDRIQVDIWEPAQKPASRASETPAAAPRPKPHSKRPAVINFHGGGFFLGLGTDDAWWTTMAAQDLDAVVFSVSYRLSPENPFPVPVEDCADAILQIASRADEFAIDPDKITLSGFSAGGNLSLASWILLNAPERWGYKLEAPVPNIACMALFYPSLDQTISRPRKRLSCSRPDLTLPQFLTDIIDASYVPPDFSPEKRRDIRLSPGLIDDELLVRLPKTHLCLCEYDMLLVEGQLFAKRLEQNGRLAAVRVVARERHAWDKPLPTSMSLKESAQAEYKAALASIKSAMAAMAASTGADIGSVTA